MVGSHSPWQEGVQPSCQFMRVMSPPDVDDNSLSGNAGRPQGPKKFLSCLLLGLHHLHLHREVRALDAGLSRLSEELLQREASITSDDGVDAKNLGDRLHRGPGRRRCQRQQPLGVQRPAEHLVEPEIVWAEVVRPLRDAVCFVDTGESDWRQAATVKGPHGKSLGRDEEHVDEACSDGAHDGTNLVARLLPRDDGAAQAQVSRQALKLVVHQRDERRDDEGEALLFQQTGRNLVAEGLA
mmetsp:Transcript_51441/g.109432  ORF Transcript_51441/g.109432 Transcript_51441/m.109432 type:complete len:240 (+) Transcript_51441:1568-2287(+)